ncbi:unnamed protein product [Prunus armeniaca]
MSDQSLTEFGGRFMNHEKVALGREAAYVFDGGVPGKRGSVNFWLFRALLSQAVLNHSPNVFESKPLRGCLLLGRD